jgi:hypothetical protein
MAAVRGHSPVGRRTSEIEAPMDEIRLRPDAESEQVPLVPPRTRIARYMQGVGDPVHVYLYHDTGEIVRYYRGVSTALGTATYADGVVSSVEWRADCKDHPRWLDLLRDKITAQVAAQHAGGRP